MPVAQHGRGLRAGRAIRPAPLGLALLSSLVLAPAAFADHMGDMPCPHGQQDTGAGGGPSGTSRSGSEAPLSSSSGSGFGAGGSGASSSNPASRGASQPAAATVPAQVPAHAAVPATATTAVNATAAVAVPVATSTGPTAAELRQRARARRAAARRAAARRLVKARNAGIKARMRAADRRFTPAPAAIEAAPARVAPPREGGSGLPLLPLGLAVLVTASLLAVLLRERRRPDEAPVAVAAPAPPEPPLTDAALVEAALQEIVAEERAARMLRQGDVVSSRPE